MPGDQSNAHPTPIPLFPVELNTHKKAQVTMIHSPWMLISEHALGKTTLQPEPEPSLPAREASGHLPYPGKAMPRRGGDPGRPARFTAEEKLPLPTNLKRLMTARLAPPREKAEVAQSTLVLPVPPPKRPLPGSRQPPRRPLKVSRALWRSALPRPT